MRWHRQAREEEGGRARAPAAAAQPVRAEPRLIPEAPPVQAQAPAPAPVQGASVQPAPPPAPPRAPALTCAAGEPIAASAAATRWTRWCCRVKKRRCVCGVTRTYLFEVGVSPRHCEAKPKPSSLPEDAGLLPPSPEATAHRAHSPAEAAAAAGPPSP